MIYDLAVIGGGINGCGIARDAVGRGLSVALFEQNDLASGTSSASTKLIHGGLRYLEFYEFRLVREALIEREVLLRNAPHIIRPLRFVLPHHRGLRPAWLLRLGLLIYDHLGGRKILPATRTIDLADDAAGVPLKPNYRRAFEYSDCWVEDSRLVVLNAMDAAARGARISPRSKVVAARRGDDRWVLSVAHDGATESVEARALVNAAGPWVGHVLDEVIGVNEPAKLRQVQGSHIVVPRLFEHDRAYIFQNADQRIIFAIPYEQDFTLIGTTDRDWHSDPAKVAASAEEIAYLCSAASEYFKRPIEIADVVWTYSGVRPLYDDGASEAQQATRDYVLQLDAAGVPLLNVFGGKITTYRKLSEAALAKLTAALPTARAAWTRNASLPGGDFPVGTLPALASELEQRMPSLGAARAARLARTYGTRARLLLDAVATNGLGRDFGAGLTEAEVAYLMTWEWAQTAADVVWRRTKLGLRLTPEEIETLDAWMRDKAITPKTMSY